MVNKLQKDCGIIINSFKYRDTSCIIHVLTQNNGLQSFLVNGVRKSKSSTSPSAVQLMASVDIDYYYGPNIDLYRVREIKPNQLWYSLTTDIKKMSMGLFMCEFTRKVIYPHEVYTEIYQLLFKSLWHIEHTEKPWNIHIWYILHLLDKIGYHFIHSFNNDFDSHQLIKEKYENYRSELDESIYETASQLFLTDITNCHQISIGQNHKKMLLLELTRHLQSQQPHQNLNFKSLDILMEIFS